MGSFAPALIQAKLWLDAPCPGWPLSMTATPRWVRRQAIAAPRMPAPMTATFRGLSGMTISCLPFHRGGRGWASIPGGGAPGQCLLGLQQDAQGVVDDLRLQLTNVQGHERRCQVRRFQHAEDLVTLGPPQFLDEGRNLLGQLPRGIWQACGDNLQLLLMVRIVHHF